MKARKITPEDYLKQVAIPAGKSGEYAVEHFKRPAGEPLDTSNLRTSLVGGQKNDPVVYGHETTWHRLVYGGGTWMTDLPIEQQQHRHCLKPLKGNILIGGLGLGLAANWLAQKPAVKSITVVEKSKEVVRLVANHIRDPRNIVKVVQQDLFKYLEENAGKKKFDWAFYDIWQSDSESTFFNTVCPLRKLSEPFVKDTHVICWNEDVMRGQLYMGLQSRYSMTKLAETAKADARLPKLPTLEDLVHPEAGDIWLQWSAPFFRAVESGAVSDANLSLMSSLYAKQYGRPGFEGFWEPISKNRDAEKAKA